MTTLTDNFGFHKQSGSDQGEDLYLDLATDLDTLDGILISKIQVQEIFMDLLIADTDGVHAAVAGTGALQTINTGMTNPDVPRNISLTSTGGVGTGETSTISGKNAFGKDDSEVINLITDDIAYGSKAFSIITSFTVPAAFDSGDTLACGFSDKVGLANPIELDSDVYKIKKNTADMVIPTVDETNATIDLDTIGSGDDFTIWYAVIITSGVE